MILKQYNRSNLFISFVLIYVDIMTVDRFLECGIDAEIIYLRAQWSKFERDESKTLGI